MKDRLGHYEPIDGFLQFYEKLGSFGDSTVFRYFGKDKQICDLSYRQLHDNIKALCAGLSDAGLSGKRIAIVGESCHMWITAYIASILGRGVAIPLDKELAVEELYGFLKISGADAIVFTQSFCRKFRDAILEERFPGITFIPMECDDEEILAKANVKEYAKILEKGFEISKGGFEVAPYTADDEMREMLFTSGTTGTSKCVMLSEKNVCASVNSACEAVDFCREDVIVSVLPLHHTYELTCSIAGMNYGMTICINDSLKYVLRNFKLFKPTGLVLVPLFVSTMHKKIFDEAKKTGKLKKLEFALKVSGGLSKIGVDTGKLFFADVLDAFGGNLKKIVCGGAPLNPKLCADFAKMGVNVYEGYGITECSPLIAVNPFRAPKSGSVGPCVNSCTAKIEKSAVNAKGFDEGEILVKGTNVMLGYFGNEEATREVFTEDGYFRTGDIGYMDGDGYLYITGRKKSVIVLENGKNVFPEEIEEYLAGVERIAESVVVGRRKEDGTVSLTALVYPAFDKFEKGAAIEDIGKVIKSDIAELNKKLPGFKQIRDVELRTTEFEKTTSRKIKRYLVK